MTAELENAFQQIGQTIADAIPRPWQSAEVSIEIEPGVVTEQAHYVPEGQTESISFDVSFDTLVRFQDLHTLMAEQPQGPWKRALFILGADGHFVVSFDY